ncbi:hypothetical protein M0805_007410 [Coniferiporia weirii]|nr:hypothetical protein M0805_007410 [Coniferiporia weirii]
MTGVVKLSGCGHVFCRRDLAEWIGSHHGSCPTCRQAFFVFTPLDEAEYESSDGGEYVPGEDDEDDDAFTDDGDIDLLPTSDFDTDTEVDLDMPGREDHASATNTIGFPGSDFRIYAEDGDIELDDDELDSDYMEEDEGAHSEGSGLSYSSDSLSSEGASVSTENDGAELYVTDVGMIADNEYTSEDELEAPSDDGCTEVKSPGPSAMEQPQHTQITQ